MKRGYLTMLRLGHHGRFANALYQVAGILGIARRNNLEPVFPPLINHCHRDRFGSTEDVDLFRHFEHVLPAIPEGVTFNSEQWIEWGYHDVDLPMGNHNLTGHFQSCRYFNNCMDQVRHYLRMKDELPQSDCVAIHLRLGDYSGDYHPRLDMRYYAPAINTMGRDERYVIFSDDLDSAHRMFGDSGFEYATGNYIDDFRLMKRCKSFIIGNSSYSAIAAVLGEHPEKRVIAPRPWFGPSYAAINGEDIYDRDWTVINYA